MLDAWQAVLDDEYVSRAESPTTNWLTELNAFAARTQPAAANADGTVAQDAFLPLLDTFLDEEVRPTGYILPARRVISVAAFTQGLRWQPTG